MPIRVGQPRLAIRQCSPFVPDKRDDVKNFEPERLHPFVYCSNVLLHVVATSIWDAQMAVMTRFYFNLYECGRVTMDEEGLLFATVRQARDRAIDEARAIMCAEVAEGRLCLNCNIEVVDDHGALATNVAFKDALQVEGV